ncbi:MAG: YjbH domain-containing protein, partial [Proteobacteria bacterium]|nr:YjbH domain-containing protein [Pseudomonadota bacterium]
MRNACFAGLAAVLTILGIAESTSARDKFLSRYEERNPPSAGDFGGIGLLQTRTARFGRDGQFDVGFSDIEPYRRYYLNLLALPWLEGTFRYSDIRNRQFIDTPGTLVDAGQTLKDRGADLKIRVLDEGQYVPALAVGLQDGVGTGLFNGEYIVASKRYRDFDFSLGLGWGNVGAAGDFENPLTFLSNSFKTRVGDVGKGGQFSIGSYFSGPRVAVFGGVEYTTPLKGLTIKVEYDGNDYQTDPRGNVLDQSSRLNFGFNYRPFPWIDLAAAYERGEAVMLRASLRANFNDGGVPNFQDPPPPPLTPRPKAALKVLAEPSLVENRSLENWQVQLSADASSDPTRSRSHVYQRADAFFEGLEAQGYKVASLELGHEEAIIHLSEGSTRVTTAAALTALRSSPLPLTRVTFHDEQRGVPTTTTFRKDEVLNASAIDGLFAAAEKWGLEVVDIEISKRFAVVWVLGDKAEQDRYLAARDFATSLSDYADTVKVVANGQNTDASQITIQTTALLAGATSGTERSVIDSDGNFTEIAEKIFEAGKNHGLLVEALQVTRTRAIVYVTPTKYREIARNVGRAAR